MNCPSCSHQNRPGAKFCEECGTALKRACTQCGANLSATAKFCGECGAQVVAASSSPDCGASSRKIVSILFADLVGSTGLHQRLDPESTRRFMESYYEVARQAVEAHGGKVTQFLGDGVKAVFGVPKIAEDDALRAVRAAVAMQDGFRALAEQQAEAVGSTGLRVAVNTGEVIAEGETEIIGDPVNVAARLQEHGGDGEVVVGESTEHLVAGQITLELLGAFDLKGRSGNVKAYRVLSLEPPQRSVAAFVGREKELARLTAVYDQALATPAAKMAVLVGSAGLGKSRLIGEFARRSASVFSTSATVIQAHCDAAKGATFSPLADALRKHLELAADASAEAIQHAVDTVLAADEDQQRIATGIVGLLSGQPAAPEETFFVVRRFLAAMTAEQPVVLIIDDLHWAEPLLFDLVEHLVQWGQNLPLLLLIGARPELREARSNFTKQGGFVSELLTLEGLDAHAAMKLAAGVIGAGDLPAAVAAKVLATSEGNPLFIGELIRMLVVEGALIHENDEWRVGDTLASVEMPPTIHALLAARIERLEPLDCAILERAAVIGRQFSRNAVTALLPNDPDEIDARLEALQRLELIERGSGWFIGDPVLRFHHVLIRDAAYRRLLKGTRAELHARLANWIEAQVGETRDHDELVGRHLEDAHRLLGELGPLDENGEKLGERAAARLAAAGRRALEADDVPLAANLLGRALERMQPDHTGRADLCIAWCEALLAEGEVSTAEQAIAELSRLMEGSDRLQAWHQCFVGQLTVLTAPRELTATVAAVAGAATALAALDDSAGEAKAHFVHALALSRQGQIGACEASLDLALAAARKANDRRQANTVLAIAPVAALWGPSPVTRASGRCLDVVRVLRITQGAPAVEAVALMCQGVLEALRGRSEAAHRMIASGREMVEELGISQRLLEADMFAGYVQLLENDLDAAERQMRRAYQGLRDLGLGIDAARAAALLAKTVLAKGEVEAAQTLSQESEALAGDDLKAAIAWRGVRAEALAQQGEHEDAIKLARKAVSIAEKTDALLDHADARKALAVALRAAGQSQEADAEEQRAQKLWNDKGAALLIGEHATEAATQNASSQTAHNDGAFSRTLRPGVQHNPLSKPGAELHAAMEQRDYVRLRGVFHDDFREVDHSTSSSWGVDGATASIKRLLESENPYFRGEVLATLGPGLELVKRQTGASSATGKNFDVGAYESTRYQLNEGDQDKFRFIESFAEDKLGDAIARFYQRYAESLPDGPERNAASAINAWVEFGQRWNLEELAKLIAADIRYVDHRHAGMGKLDRDSILQALRVMKEELSHNLQARAEDVLRILPNALLCHYKDGGTDKRSGGAFERQSWEVWVFSDEGQLSHWERFELENKDQALARFDELTDEITSPDDRIGISLRPGVQPNQMTNFMTQFVEALKRRDFAWHRREFTDSYREIDHPTGSTIDKAGTIASLERLFRSEAPYYQVEVFATLGPNLQLGKHVFGAKSAASKNFDVGAYENVRIQIDDSAMGCEVFDANHLGDAIARLHERYAESLPDSIERTRALGVAEIFKAIVGPMDYERLAACMAPNVLQMDHRHVGSGTLCGADAVNKATRLTLIELTENIVGTVDEVLALRPQGTLFRFTNTGNLRNTGGEFERNTWELTLHDEAGLLSHWERFDLKDADKALARFEELTGNTKPKPVERIVQPNLATEATKHALKAIAERNWEAARTYLHDDLVEIDHTTGASIGPDQMMSSVQLLFHGDNPVYHIETLATLGPHLMLAQRKISSSGARGKRFDVGEYANTTLHLAEFDDENRMCYAEVFAENKLGDALIRLYERYAETLPEAAQRDLPYPPVDWLKRFALGKVATEADFEAMRRVMVADCVAVDHRHVGFGTLSGIDAILQAALMMACELSENYVGQVVDIRGVNPRAMLVLHRSQGVDRNSGGQWERAIWEMYAFSTDGVSRWERFDEEHLGDALARFDELTNSPEPGPVKRIVRPNLATQGMANAARGMAAEDWEEMRRWIHDELVEIDHTTGAKLGQEELVSSVQLLFKGENPKYLFEPMATLGPHLALGLRRISSSGAKGKRFDVGAYAHTALHLLECDDQNRLLHAEVFAEHKLGESVACLYQRFAESLPEGPERERAMTTARAVTLTLTKTTPQLGEEGHTPHLTGLESSTVEQDAFVPDTQGIDHRPVVGGIENGNWYQRMQEVMPQRASDTSFQLKDIFALSSEALLRHITYHGHLQDGGGEFELDMYLLSVFGPDGRQEQIEAFEPGQEDKALARFDELNKKSESATPAHRAVTPNLCTEWMKRWDAAVSKQDWAAARKLARDDFIEIDHPNGTSYGQDALIERIESLTRSDNPWTRNDPIATLGDRLGLFHRRWGASGAQGKRYEVGAYEYGVLMVFESDEQGPSRGTELFAENKLGDALIRIYELYAESLPEGPGRDRACRIASGWTTLNGPVDIEHMTKVTAPSCKLVDHRIYGAWTSDNAEEMLQHFRAQLELAPDFACRIDEVIELAPDAACLRYTYYGTDRTSGGLFENCFCGVHFFGSNEQGPRIEVFEREDIDKARVRFKELTAVTPTATEKAANEDKVADYFCNTATRAFEGATDAYRQKDWASFATYLADDVKLADRRPILRVDLEGKDKVLEYFRPTGDLQDTQVTQKLIASRGDRLAIRSLEYQGSGGDIGPSEFSALDVIEVNEEGLVIAFIRYSLDDVDQAYAELDARHEKSEGIDPEYSNSAYTRAYAERDWDTISAMTAPGFTDEDRSTLSLFGTIGGDDWVSAERALVELAPDAQVRFDHIRRRERYALGHITFYGTRDGGPFEIAYLTITEIHADGRFLRNEFYEPKQIDEAAARFEELTAVAPTAAVSVSGVDKVSTYFSNAATNAHVAFIKLYMDKAWDSAPLILAEDVRISDHRRLLMVETEGRDQYLEYFRALGDLPNTKVTPRLLATRGERLTLSYDTLVVSGDDVGESEVHILDLFCLNETGEIDHVIRFSPEDLDAAYAELDSLYYTGEAAGRKANQQQFREALAARDWDALSALAAPDFVEHDHRPLAVLGTRHGPQSWAETTKALVELAPDTQIRLDHIRLGPGCSLNHATFHGSREGGEFEMPFITVAQYDAEGLLLQHDLYEPEQLEKAVARFEALKSNPSPS